MIMDNYAPIEVGNACADYDYDYETSSSSVDWDVIEGCSNSVEGEQLLASHGDQTPTHLTFIPHVLIGGRELPKDSLHRFKEVVCNEYVGNVKPQTCL